MSYSNVAFADTEAELELAAAVATAGADADEFDEFVEPYGPVGHDEASWFAPWRDEREALALVARLLGR